MRLVIYILVSKHYLPPNSLNITVFVFYVSWSMVNGKERSRPFLFVCLFVLPWKINQSRSIWFCCVSVMSGVWNRPRRSVWISMPYGNRNSRSHKSSSSIIGLLSYSAELEILYIFFVIMWDEYSKKVLSPSSYALLFSKWKELSTKIQSGAPNGNFRENICSDVLAESLVIRKL